jgi:predicted transcriptional regulator
MKRLGLIEVNGGLSTTTKGRKFINEYRKVENILQQFGLSQ